MTTLQVVYLVLTGLVAGTLSGMFGIGGGLIMVPAMTYLVGFPIKTALGTSLSAMLLPFAILGVLEYYKQDNVNIKAALLLVVGLFIGSLFGAKITLSLSDALVKRAFGVFCLLVAAKYLIGK